MQRRGFANPLSPPCIPPKFVLHGLSSKSKFLAVWKRLQKQTTSSDTKPASSTHEGGDDNWEEIDDGIEGVGEITTFIDTGVSVDDKKRFYRVIELE